MTLHFPDINVWVALTVQGHIHNDSACRWLSRVRQEDRLIFSRYTQMGLLRLLTNASIMREQVLKTVDAWAVFDAWLADPRVEFYPEPRSVDTAFRQATAPFSNLPASKSIGDSYLLAFARETDSTLVTFDQALHKVAVSNGYAALIPQ